MQDQDGQINNNSVSLNCSCYANLNRGVLQLYSCNSNNALENLTIVSDVLF
jgi:hypothetical protein